MPLEKFAAVAAKLGVDRAPAMLLYVREGNALKITARHLGPMEAEDAAEWALSSLRTPAAVASNSRRDAKIVRAADPEAAEVEPPALTASTPQAREP